VPRSIDDPVPSHQVNIDGTFNVLRAAHEGRQAVGVCRFLLGIWRHPGVTQGGEHDAEPKSPYALQKLVGEYYCKVFAGVYGVETVALRYSMFTDRGRIRPVLTRAFSRCL